MKHAFLIMAHTNYPLVARLLKKLDHENNNIYLHIDAKSTLTEEDKTLLLGSCTKSTVKFTPRYSVNWGAYSQINIEMRMLEFASADQNDYYHFLSGVDFPIKPMAYIHEFFENHKGTEFVHFCSDEFNASQKKRFSYYHFLQEKCGRQHNIYMYIKFGLLLLQKILRVDRTRKFKEYEYKGGSNWVSVTHDFVCYLLGKQDLIKKMFRDSACCDEFFLQTVLYNSPYKEKIYNLSSDDTAVTNLRFIDWERGDKAAGSPYTFKADDFHTLLASENLFCRKVGNATDAQTALLEKLEEL